MNLKAKTVEVLKNFSTINPSIVVKSGNELRTISPSKTIVAVANVEDKFETPFAIYDLSKFLATYSLFEDPDLDFDEKAVTIRKAERSVNYVFAEPSNIRQAPDSIKMPKVNVTVKITNQQLADAMKASAILRLPQLAIEGDGEKVILKAIDVKSPTSDSYSAVIAASDVTFKAVLMADYIRILPGDYDVDISSAGLALFNGPDAKYYIALENKDSKF